MALSVAHAGDLVNGGRRRRGMLRPAPRAFVVDVIDVVVVVVLAPRKQACPR
jgi:hypothetical protein